MGFQSRSLPSLLWSFAYFIFFVNFSCRCQELLHQKDGPKWREKFELPSVAWWEIPEIIDVEGKPTSQVVFVNPVRTAQQTCSASQSAPAGQQKDSPREVKDKPKEMSASEKYEKFKAEGNDFVKKVNILGCPVSSKIPEDRNVGFETLLAMLRTAIQRRHIEVNWNYKKLL